MRDQCQRTAHLNRRLRELVPAPLLDRVRLAHADRERVILEVESSAWLTRLRFHLPQVEAILRRELGIRARNVVVRVAAPLSNNSPTRGERPVISEQSAESIASCARSVDDSELAAALTRLAGRGQR